MVCCCPTLCIGPFQSHSKFSHLLRLVMLTNSQSTQDLRVSERSRTFLCALSIPAVCARHRLSCGLARAETQRFLLLPTGHKFRLSPCKHVKSPRSGKWKELWTMWVHDVFVRDVLNYVSKIRLRPWWWWWWWEGWFPMPLNWNITEVMELSAYVWWKSRGGSHRKKK